MFKEKKMIIFNALYKKNEDMITRLEKEANVLFKKFYFHNINENFDEALTKKLSSSSEIKSICNEFEVTATIKQCTSFDKKRTSNTAFIELESTNVNSQIEYSFYLKADPIDESKNVLKFYGFDFTKRGIQIRVNDREMSIEMKMNDYFYFIICKDPWNNNELGFGLRGYEIKNYKKAVARYNKNDKEYYPEHSDFYLTLDFLNKLYESHIFDSNPELVCTILLNAFNGVKSDKDLVDVFELTHDVKLKFLTNPCPLLHMYDSKKTFNQIKNII